MIWQAPAHQPQCCQAPATNYILWHCRFCCFAPRATCRAAAGIVTQKKRPCPCGHPPVCCLAAAAANATSCCTCLSISGVSASQKRPRMTLAAYSAPSSSQHTAGVRAAFEPAVPALPPPAAGSPASAQSDHCERTPPPSTLTATNFNAACSTRHTTMPRP